ncbi:A-kinase anchor protein 12b [Xenentodon cancila]
MGAQGSAQRDGKSEEDASASASASASAGELSAEVKVLQEGGGVIDSKPLEKNGQISSMSSLNGHSEDNVLTKVGQPDGVSVAQKEETPENMDTIPDEVTAQVNGEKVDKESPDANDISAVEAKETDDKSDDASEVGFKKIFTIVGLKFTLKKDKSDEGEPVKLLTVKDKEGEITESDESTKDKEEATTDDNSTTEKMENEIEATAAEEEVTKDTDKAETVDTNSAAVEGSSEAVKEEEAEKETKTPPAPKEPGLSPFRKLFFIGLFSNLRKKTSVKKMKEEEEKAAAVQEDAAKSEECVAEVKEKKDAEQETNEEKGVAEQEKKEKNAETELKTEEKAAAEAETKEESVVTEEKSKQEATHSPTESKSETKEEVLTTPKEEKSDSAPEVTAEASAPAETSTTDEKKQVDEKAEAAAKEDKAPMEVTSEAELLVSQEKAKAHGSPLKKLFTGTGLKKLSTKRQKSKKDTESKPTESSEQGTEQLQSSTESEEPPKAENGLSSPEASGEHEVALEVNQNESSHDAESEVVSDGEKKKDGVIASFKKLVTPKKHAKRSSDSEDEGTSDKPTKSDTLSSSESAPLANKAGEEDETKEEKTSEEEPKTENTEKLTSSTEETKKKMDTSVSWEALMCMGGPKKRTRKTSDSDDEETKAEDELPAAATAAAAAEGGQEDKTEAAVTTPTNPESEGIAAAPAPEPSSAPVLRESPWATLKRLVMVKSKPKSEEKPEGPADQVQPEPEAPKDESSFSLKMFFPVRRKKAVEKQVSVDQGLGEEDSDTPAVVPLSEYEQVEAAQNAPGQTAGAQNKADPEDRAPSWIPAVIDDATDKHDQLSDIPEEAENAATPKSVDTDVAEEEPEDQAMQYKGPENTGRRLSTAEVKPITQAPAALTSPVPQGPQSEKAQEVFGSIEAQITEIPSQTCVTLEDIPVSAASKKTEDELQTEVAMSETNTTLEPHGQGEATTICTGLETAEIEKVAIEQPAEAAAESMIPVSSVVTTEVAVEEKPLASEEAAVAEDPVVKVHIHQVESLEFQPVAENLAAEAADVQAASGSYESEIEKVGVVGIESSEVIQPTTPKENSPKAVIVNPIAPTLETALCTQTAEVSEVTVETKEVKIETEQLVATEESVSQTEAEDVSSTKVKGAETATPAVVPSDEAAVVTETVVLVAPNDRQLNQQATSDMAVMENSSEPASADVQAVMQKRETREKQKTEEMKEEVHPASEIETQSVVIAQAVIQDAVEKVAAKPKNSTNPTATAAAPVQAKATTEKEIDTANEQLVITDTPVPVTCEKPLKKSPQPLCVAMEMIETVPIEVTEDINKQSRKEEKPVKRLKQAEVVTESEEMVIEEEIMEIKAESDECPEEKKSEAPSEEKKESPAVRQPVQVVLQAAEAFEEPPFEVETVDEFDENRSAAAENPSRQNKCSAAASEGDPETGSAEAAAPSQGTDAADKKPSAKCAEVMAQVIEVIEEAVKEIEPLSTEITAAS